MDRFVEQLEHRQHVVITGTRRSHVLVTESGHPTGI
jgi:hypothetical protein